VFTLFGDYEKNGTSYLLGNRSTLLSHSTLRFLVFASVTLCVELRGFEKHFGRNKECGLHGEKGNLIEVIYSKSFLGRLLQHCSKPLSQKKLPIVAGVDSAGGTSGRLVSTMSGHRTNTTSGDVLDCGYMLE
jgi:hypothetical protein